MGGRLKPQETAGELKRKRNKNLKRKRQRKNFTINGVLFKKRTGNAHVNLLNRAAATLRHEGVTASSVYDR